MNGTSKTYRDPDRIIADFAETTHVPTSYINSTLSAVGTQAQISDATNQLLHDLESASTKASAKLSSLVDDMLRMAPRLGYEVEVLRGDLQNMKKVVEDIEPKRVALSDKGEATIAKLKMLDTVKAQMEETGKVFEEAKAWNPPNCIEQPLNLLIANKEWAQTSKQIVKYEGLLQVWRGTSEYAKRKAVVDKIRKKLMDVRHQDGVSKASLEVTRSSMDSQRSTESTGTEEGYYSSFIKRAFKT